MESQTVFGNKWEECFRLICLSQVAIPGDVYGLCSLFPGADPSKVVVLEGEVDCKTIGFLISPVSLSVFSLVPDLLFDCSRVLEYAIIRTVLQSKGEVVCKT